MAHTQKEIDAVLRCWRDLTQSRKRTLSILGPNRRNTKDGAWTMERSFKSPRSRSN